VRSEPIGGLDGAGHPLDRIEKHGEKFARQVAECLDVVPGHDQNVPGEHGCPVEEGDDRTLVEHDVSARATVHNGAEDAGHRRSMTVVPDMPVSFSTGLGETVLPPVSQDLARRLEAARANEDASERRASISRVVATEPTYLEGWADLGDEARDPVEAYACYRVGYHRGLDALRAAGWRGSGYVRWSHESNRGFLRSLMGLADAAARLGEQSEADRCRTFAAQLDAEWSATQRMPEAAD